MNNSEFSSLNAAFEPVTISITLDSYGSNISYKLSKNYEGTMLFFPAKLRHCVYPFYGTDEPRISIAGNLNYFLVD